MIKFTIFILLFLSITVAAFIYFGTWGQNAKSGRKTVVINSTIKVYVEIADTGEKQMQGLSGREKLNANEGMLFIFSNPSQYPFWMKDMMFDLDFLWIRGDEVVDIHQNVSHNNEQRQYFPKVPIDKVLEVNAGFVEKNGIKVGDKISIK